MSALSAVLLFWSATAWLGRAETREVALAPSGPYRLASDAGPIEVTTAAQPTLTYRASWFLSGPDQWPTDSGAPAGLSGASEVTVRCGTVMPCRAASTLRLPVGAALRIEAGDNDVLVEHFDGDLTVEVSGIGDVHLGPVAGTVAVDGRGGDVHGFGLTATEVEVVAEGEINLRFAAQPRRVTVQSGPEPLTISLPDGVYAVSVVGGAQTVIAVEQAASAESEIFVQANGLVRIESDR